MRDPLIAAVMFNFVALVVVAVLWSAESRRADRLAYELACLRYDLGLPEPLPEPRWWERVGDWLRAVPGEDDEEQPADTVESPAVVIGGARVVGKTAEPKTWMDERIEQYRRTGSWK